MRNRLRVSLDCYVTDSPDLAPGNKNRQLLPPRLFRAPAARPYSFSHSPNPSHFLDSLNQFLERTRTDNKVRENALPVVVCSRPVNMWINLFLIISALHMFLTEMNTSIGLHGRGNRKAWDTFCTDLYEHPVQLSEIAW